MFNLAGGLSTIPRKLNPRNFILTLAFLSLLMVACSPGSNNPIISSEQKAGGPEYSGIIVTTDMSVGVNRILFGVINRDGMPVAGSGILNACGSGLLNCWISAWLLILD